MRNSSTATAAVVAFFFITACALVSGQALAPGPSSVSGPSSSDDCLTKLMNMSDCLSYVTAGSNVTEPDKPCCPELAGLVDSNPLCLCELLGKSDTFGIKIDLNRALKLPSVCGVTTPPVDLCSVAGIPVGVPTASEGPTSSGVQPPAELAASPLAGNNGSAASSSAGPVLTVLVALAFALLV